MARKPFGQLWSGTATEAISRMVAGDGFAALAMTDVWGVGASDEPSVYLFAALAMTCR